ncbi:transcriptional regulator [Sphingomonas kaistensis]|uniref:Transcriptional regulator n=1 Tax=Sphingomonas kaistensis TaxID=298708 RepID=A0ABZ2G2Z7_9SPHN
MNNEVLEFGGFRLEPAERRLTRDGAVVDVSGRYLDALLLLARQPGELVTKDRFMAEVWRGVPVTDEALTQCIRALRKALGDQAGRPRFIETVPRHGYRFLAEVSAGGEPTRSVHSAALPRLRPIWLPWFDILLLAGAGLAGGAAAGLLGGVGYGMLAATEPPPGTGAISIVLVMTCLCLLVGMIGGLGVAAGSALGRIIARGRLMPLMLGGALGGMLIGSLGRLIGLDAFALLIGSRPLAITGGSEGLIIGAMAGAALWLAERGRPKLGVMTGKGALLGALAGLLVTFGGGKMMAGSLAGLAAAHPDAPLGPLLASLTPTLLLLAGAVEGAIFIAALALAFTLTLRSRGAD